MFIRNKTYNFAPEKTFNMDIRKRIREQGWTVTQLAKEFNISQGSLSTLINSENPNYKSLERIAKTIGISVSELVKDADDNQAIIVCPHCGEMINLSASPKNVKSNRKSKSE